MVVSCCTPGVNWCVGRHGHVPLPLALTTAWQTALYSDESEMWKASCASLSKQWISGPRESPAGRGLDIYLGGWCGALPWQYVFGMQRGWGLECMWYCYHTPIPNVALGVKARPKAGTCWIVQCCSAGTQAHGISSLLGWVHYPKLISLLTTGSLTGFTVSDLFWDSGLL